MSLPPSPMSRSRSQNAGGSSCSPLRAFSASLATEARSCCFMSAAPRTFFCRRVWCKIGMIMRTGSRVHNKQDAPCVPRPLAAPPPRSAPSFSHRRRHPLLYPRQPLAFAFPPLRPLHVAGVRQASQSRATYPCFVKAGPYGQTVVVGSSSWGQSLCPSQQHTTVTGMVRGQRSQLRRSDEEGGTSIHSSRFGALGLFSSYRQCQSIARQVEQSRVIERRVDYLEDRYTIQWMR